MLIKTHKYFNQLTRQALLDHVNGYVDKTSSLINELKRLKSKYGIEKIYRFDLGENADGYSPNIQKYINSLHLDNKLTKSFNEYPEVTHRKLREDISKYYNVSRDQVVISTGLDSMLDLIARVFIDYKDFYLMAVPDFFLFENYSERMGAMPLFIQLEEKDDYAWTKQILAQYADSITRFKPKIVWLSNPSNPTGQVISDEIIREILKIAHANNVFVVIDEAYGEFVLGNKSSAIKYVQKYENLMVLRTFSKAFGLAGIRLGYLVCSSLDIVEALLMHRQHFPATQLSLNIASRALQDQDYIFDTINRTSLRKNSLFEKLDTLKTFRYIPSSTNIFMLKNNYMTDEKLSLLLKHKGIITSMLNITGIENKNYLRVTIRMEEENNYLFNVCKDIEEEIFHSIKIGEENLPTTLS